VTGAAVPVAAVPVAAVVLAAGEGRRLRPLTAAVPKALCPVGNTPLLDLALGRLAGLGYAGAAAVAVNAWYLADQVVTAVAGRAKVSREPGTAPLGTAGGVALVRDWIAGRGVLVCNADAYLHGGDLAPLLAGWDGRRTRILGVAAGAGQAGEFGRYRFAGCSLLPWHRVAGLAAEPADLVRTVWRPAERDGELDVVDYRGTYLDTGTPRDYLAANLHAACAGAGPDGSIVDPTATVTGSVRRAVIGAGATVRGRLDRCVVWPGGYVDRAEGLAGVIRYGRAGTVPAAG